MNHLRNGPGPPDPARQARQSVQYMGQSAPSRQVTLRSCRSIAPFCYMRGGVRRSPSGPIRRPRRDGLWGDPDAGEDRWVVDAVRGCRNVLDPLDRAQTLGRSTSDREHDALGQRLGEGVVATHDSRRRTRPGGHRRPIDQPGRHGPGQARDRDHGHDRDADDRATERSAQPAGCRVGGALRPFESRLAQGRPAIGGQLDLRRRRSPSRRSAIDGLGDLGEIGVGSARSARGGRARPGLSGPSAWRSTKSISAGR